MWHTDPITARTNEQMAEAKTGDAASYLAALRGKSRSHDAPLPDIEGLDELTIDGPGGEMPLLLVRPKSVRGVLMYVHGGGFVGGTERGLKFLRGGSNAGKFEYVTQLAARLQIAIVSVGYRLAPEHPFPAGVEDCEAAALCLGRHAESELGSSNFALAAQSAGCNLAVAAMVRLRDKHGMRPFKGMVLANGIYDLRLTPSTRAWASTSGGLPVPIETIDQCRRWYAPAGNFDDPEVSPLFADLSGLSPALFLTGTREPFLDDNLFMEARWRAAGGETELMVCPEGSHEFPGQDTPDGELARATINRFISRVLQ